MASAPPAAPQRPPPATLAAKAQPLHWQALSAGLHLLGAHVGDASPENRGFVAHLLLAVEPRTLWLVGSGPSPVFGAAVRASLERRWPGRAIELISPWAHPETVLGVAGLRPARHWAHGAVAEQMAQRCEGCLQRLAQRMGPAAVDLQSEGAPTGSPIRLPDPDRRLSGLRGRLGPFEWWCLPRAADVTVTLWRSAASGLVFAPGLVATDGPPDGRDGDVEALKSSLQLLQADAKWSGSLRWLGQQGRMAGAESLGHTARYWQGLDEAAVLGLERGDDGFQAPESLPGVPPAWCRQPLHALNWQRVWRQAESRWLQRSLR